jgi:hypothetical protein
VLLLLAPGAARGGAVEIEGGPPVLGRTERAAALIRVDEPAEGALPLRLAVSAGSFGPPERVGPGLWRAAYSPPATRYPQTAIVALWREGGPAEVEVLRFPLQGITRLPVKAAPGSSVSVDVAGRSFGPAAAGADGQVAIPLEVPPGASQALVTVRRGKDSVLRKVGLEMPQGNRLLAVAIRTPGASGAGPAARVLVVYDGAGEGFRPERLSVRASAGEVVREGSSGPVHSFRWTPPAKPVAEVAFAASVEGDARSSSEARLQLPPPPRPPPPPPPVQVAAARAPAPRLPAAAPPLPQAAAAAPAPAAAHSFLLGSRAGYASAGGGLAGPRAGLELWSSFPSAALPAGYGLLLGAGSLARPAGAPGGALDAFVAPLSLRAAWELRLGSAFVGRLGGGFVAAWALSRGQAGAGQGFGHGAAAFASASWRVRSAEVFAEASWGRAPVRAGSSPVDAAGLAVETGFRVGAF